MKPRVETETAAILRRCHDDPVYRVSLLTAAAQELAASARLRGERDARVACSELVLQVQARIDGGNRPPRGMEVVL